MTSRSERKALTRAYKLAMPPMGIFAIRNAINGKMLIDSSTHVHATLNRHRTELRFGTHRNTTLLGDWRTYGEANFVFAVWAQIDERAEPDFDYHAELERLLATWRMRVPSGSALSYLPARGATP